MPNDPRDSVENPYGTTTQLNRRGDLAANSLNQLAELGGSGTVIQRLKVRLLTPLGHSPIAPEFGIDIEALGGNEDVFVAEITRAIEEDPDVEAVENVDIEHPVEVAGPDAPTVVTVTVRLTSGTTRSLTARTLS